MISFTSGALGVSVSFPGALRGYWERIVERAGPLLHARGIVLMLLLPEDARAALVLLDAGVMTCRVLYERCWRSHHTTIVVPYQGYTGASDPYNIRIRLVWALDQIPLANFLWVPFSQKTGTPLHGDTVFTWSMAVAASSAGSERTPRVSSTKKRPEKRSVALSESSPAVSCSGGSLVDFACLGCSHALAACFQLAPFGHDRRADTNRRTDDRYDRRPICRLLA
jgi:hypothetical protein